MDKTLSSARHHLSRRGLLLGLAVALQGPVAGAETQQLRGRVVAVTDGDTLTLLTAERRQVRVRLVEIDAPEAGQPWGRKAKQALSGYVFNRAVTVRVEGSDRYGRLLGRVFAGGRDVNADMVRDGQAWAYRAYLTDRSLLQLEADARRERRGLWSLPPEQRVPPWTWRRGARAS